VANGEVLWAPHENALATNLNAIEITIGNATNLAFCLLVGGPDPYCSIPGPGGAL